MSIFTLISNLFTTAEEVAQDVDEVVPRSSRAGQPQACSVCGIKGHKSPSHKPDKVRALQRQVAAFESRVAEAEDRAAEAESRAELAEADNRVLWEQIGRLRRVVAELNERLIIAEGYAQVVTYGEGTGI